MTYTEDDIQVLSDRDHVRLRLPVYAGSINPCVYPIPCFLNNTFEIKQMTFVPAIYKCIGEIFDNSLDEFAQIKQRNKCITIQADPAIGEYEISDNGRGVPIGKHAVGKYTPEVVFGSLRSGRNFSEGREVGVIGMNGMGSAIVNICSTKFFIDIHRDGKRYRQTFRDGALNVTKPSLRKSTTKHTGTSIKFQLDPLVFPNVSLPCELMENKAIEIALTNPNIMVKYNGISHKFKNGFKDVVEQISNQYFCFSSDHIEIYVIFDINNEIDEQMFTWVNSSLLFDGGICNTQFLNAFYDRTAKHLESEAKKQKSTITKNDIRQKLLILGNIKLTDPEYDAQSKTRLTGPSLRKEFVDLVGSSWKQFSRHNKDWFEQVMSRATARHHAAADTQAIKDHQKSMKRKVPGLLDANHKTRSLCQLLVTEGESAASSIGEVRNASTTASLPLRGKINNIYGNTAAQILKMPKLQGLLSAVGLVPGVTALRGNLRYGKLVIATDSDYDGSDIFTLLINLLYTYWPELFNPDNPFVYRLVAPNVCAVKGKKRIHFSSLAEFEQKGKRYQNWTIHYYKGLGSMEPIDWRMMLTDTNTLIPIVDDGKIKDTLELLFSPNADARKEWLQE